MGKYIKFISVIVGVVFLVSCVPEMEGQVTVSGSTTVAPAMRALAHEFYNETGISVYIQEIGTSSGITATIEGGSDIAMSSRALRDDELLYLTEVNFAIDGLVIIVNPENKIIDLSFEELLAIFSGDITNWRYLGGHDSIITVVSREEGSGARASFESFLRLDNPSYSIIQNTTGGILASVASNRNAIGYVASGPALSANVALVSIDGVSFSADTILDGSYPFANRFYIAHPDSLSEEAYLFLQFILSVEGQRTVQQAGYVGVR